MKGQCKRVVLFPHGSNAVLLGDRTKKTEGNSFISMYPITGIKNTFFCSHYFFCFLLRNSDDGDA